MAMNDVSTVLPISPMQYQKFATEPALALRKPNPDYLISLVLSVCITTISTVMHNPGLVSILLVASIATSFEKTMFKWVEQLHSYFSKQVRLRQIIVAVTVVGLLLGLGVTRVNAQAAPAGGGLFNPLQQQTNAVLTQAGVAGTGNSILGIFGLMNIMVTIAGVGGVVYGAYQQGQGHTLRESFTPLALVLVVYIGCSFVMRMFLGTNAA